MAETFDEKLIKDVLSVYQTTEQELNEKLASQVQKGLSTGFTEAKLSDTTEMIDEISKVLSKGNMQGKEVIAGSIIDSYVEAYTAGITPKTSSIDVSGISNKQTQEAVQKAFDFAKSMDHYTDPDTVFQKVEYASGSQAKKMQQAAIGAEVVGDTIYINKEAEKYIDDSFIMHEIGHKLGVAGSGTSDAGQEAAAEELAKKLGYKNAKEMAAIISPYATKSATEMYPEALMEFYNAVQKGEVFGSEKKKIVDAIMQQMYSKDPKVAANAQAFLNDLNIPMNLKMSIMAVNGLLDNAELQILRNVDDAYKQVQAETISGMTSGNDTRLQATQKMLNNFANRGITSFTDKSGRNWSLASYAEMAARTNAAHAALQGHIQRSKELGEDLMKVSTIGATCPLCAPWQGVVISISGNTPEYKTLSQATEARLFHPNCRHTINLYVEELDGPGKKELNDVKPDDRDQVRNDLLMKQRYNERQIRHWKRREQLAITPEEKAHARSKVGYWQNKNLKHCQDNDLRRLYYREGNPVGYAAGPKGAPIGGTKADQEAFISKVVGEAPKDIYNYTKQYYGAKEVPYDKWLKDEITSLDNIDVELAYMKDANNKDFTPTSMYKKYIGDDPKADWVALGGEDGTGSKYGKWLSDQAKQIGTGYKLKPQFVEVQEALPAEDKALSATELFKKYNDGKSPTAAFKELGGEEALGMKYGKWIEQQKKDIVAKGTVKQAPFENKTVAQTQKVIADATSKIESVKEKEVPKVEPEKEEKTLKKAVQMKEKAIAKKSKGSELKPLSEKEAKEKADKIVAGMQSVKSARAVRAMFDMGAQQMIEADGKAAKKMVAEAVRRADKFSVSNAQAFLKREMQYYEGEQDPALKPLYAAYDYTRASSVYNQYAWGEKDKGKVNDYSHPLAKKGQSNLEYASEWVPELQKVFDSISPVTKPITLKRIVNSNGLTPMLGLEDGASSSEIKARLDEMQSSGFQETISNSGFSSMGTYKEASWTGTVGIVTQVTPGTKALYAEAFSHFTNNTELETILQPNQPLRIVRVATPADSDYRELRKKLGWGLEVRDYILITETVPTE